MKNITIIVLIFISIFTYSQTYHDKIAFSYGYHIVQTIDKGKSGKYINMPTVCTFNVGDNKSKVVCTNEILNNKTYINTEDDLFDNSQKIVFPKPSQKYIDYKLVSGDSFYYMKLCTDRLIMLDGNGSGYVFYDYTKMKK